MLNSRFQKQITKSITISVFAGLALWLLLLMQASSRIHTLPIGSNTSVGFGPVVLNHLSKQSVSGGSFSVTLSFEPTLLAYALVCVGLGIAAGYLAARTSVRR